MFSLSLRRFSTINSDLSQSFRYISNAFDKMPVFKSAQSLDQLYPKSTTSSETTQEIKTSSESEDNVFNGHIPINKLQISYCRSSGPGGQHVNTTNTKVTLQFHLSSADWIPNETKQRLEKLHKNHINKDGFWLIRSEKTRAQALNLADCMDKLRCFVTEASKPLYKPSIETLEILRERREKAALKRLQQKKIRSTTKSDRRSTD